MASAAHARPVPAPKRQREATERPALRVVPPRRRLRAGPTMALGIGLFFATAFALVFFQNVLVQGQGRLDDLNTRIDDASELQAELRLQVAELESPARIVEAATTDLGMVPPPGITYLTPSGLVTVPSPADDTTP